MIHLSTWASDKPLHIACFRFEYFSSFHSLFSLTTWMYLASCTLVFRRRSGSEEMLSCHMPLAPLVSLMFVETSLLKAGILHRPSVAGIDLAIGSLLCLPRHVPVFGSVRTQPFSLSPTLLSFSPPPSASSPFGAGTSIDCCLLFTSMPFAECTRKSSLVSAPSVNLQV